MRKGKFGIVLNFYAVLAFILAFLSQNMLCLLLLGFVILVEKDEWLSRQVIQAFIMALVVSFISSVFAILNIFAFIPILGSVVSGLISFITGIINLVVLIFVIMALSRVAKGQEANVPLAAKFANWAYGVVEQKVYTNAAPPPNQQYNNPNVPPQGQQQTYHAPDQQPPQANPVPPQQNNNPNPPQQ